MIGLLVLLAMIICGVATTVAWNKWGAAGGILIGLGTIVLIYSLARWLGAFARNGSDPRFF
jgi:hypothetical protein